jgi:hypothetical protein
VCSLPFVFPRYVWYYVCFVDMETQIAMPAPTDTYERDPIESFRMTTSEELTPKAAPRKGTIDKDRSSEGDDIADSGMECECHVSVRVARCLSFPYDTDQTKIEDEAILCEGGCRRWHHVWSALTYFNPRCFC